MIKRDGHEDKPYDQNTIIKEGARPKLSAHHKRPKAPNDDTDNIVNVMNRDFISFRG